MVTILITSFFVLAFLAIAVYYWQKPASSTDGEALLRPPGRALFIDGTPEGLALAAANAEFEASADSATRRRELVERAMAGEKSTLLDARNAGDPETYEEVLNSLVAGAVSDPKVLSLVSYIARNELRVNKNLAEKVIDSYKRSPSRNSTATTLHIAALSDDAVVYQNAAEAALEFWRGGRLSQISAPELHSILDGEFWTLSSSTRSSGAGFLLKRTLASARRELEAAHNINPTQTT